MKRTVCPLCKKWVCNDCGAKRSYANSDYADQHCPKCQSRSGHYVDQTHTSLGRYEDHVAWAKSLEAKKS